MKLRHLLANSPKVKQIDKQKLTQREVSELVGEGGMGAPQVELCSSVELLAVDSPAEACWFLQIEYA